MARNLENSTSENSNIQEMGPRRSTRLKVTISGAAPPPRVSTTRTIVVATTVATHDEVHGAITKARVVPSKATTQAMLLQAQREPNALSSRAQASHRRVPHAKQFTPVTQPAPVRQPTLVAQPAPTEQPTAVAQPAPAEQPTLVAHPTLVAFQATQDYLNHLDLPSSRGHSHHISSRIWHFPTQISCPESTTLPLLKEAHCFQALPIQMASNTCLDKS